MDITENIIKDRKIVEYHQIIVHNYWDNLSKVKYIVNLINDDKILKEQGFPTNLLELSLENLISFQYILSVEPELEEFSPNDRNFEETFFKSNFNLSDYLKTPVYLPYYTLAYIDLHGGRVTLRITDTPSEIYDSINGNGPLKYCDHDNYLIDMNKNMLNLNNKKEL